MNNKRLIYLDNAATTPLLPQVKEAMAKVADKYGNPSSLYEIGQEAHRLVEESRRTVAEYLGCKPECIAFNSGGSEGDNHALISAFLYAQDAGLGNHIITSKIEHHAILHTCKVLERYYGARVTYLDVDKDGLVRLDELNDAIGLDTFLVSIMGANNEIGTVQDLAEIRRITDNHGVLFHSDCVQLFPHERISVDNIDMMSVSAHKFGGAKGTGFFYKSPTTPPLPPLISGGSQENGTRAGTENVMGIVGLAEAVRQLSAHVDEWESHVAKLSVHILGRISSEIPGVTLNGGFGHRLAGNLNFSIRGVRGEELMTLLDVYGVCVSTGSACNSSSGEPSHVLLAIGLDGDAANSSVRITLSHENTMEDVDFAVDCLKRQVARLRG